MKDKPESPVMPKIKLYKQPQPPKFKCPKHGYVGGAAMLVQFINDISDEIETESFERFHCFLCYAEFIKKNVPELKEVKE